MRIIGLFETETYTPDQLIPSLSIPLTPLRFVKSIE